MAYQVDEDLIRILNNCTLKADVRVQGWQYILGLTASEDGLKRILAFKKYVPLMLSYFERSEADSETIALVHKCIINISSTKDGATALLSGKEDFILHLLNCICNIDSNLVEHMCYTLSNVSTHFDVLASEQVPSTLSDFFKKFPKVFFPTTSTEQEKFKFLALVFANVSRKPDGRRFFVSNEDFLSHFIGFSHSDEPDIRRLGVALTLRNCCFETSCHKRLLEQTDLLTVLLLPLMGPEEYEEEQMDKLPIDCQYLESSKEREKIPQIRRALVQALSLLCYTETGWSYLKSKGVYVVSRDLHLWERDENAKEAIETLVGFLLVDNYSTAEVGKLSDISAIIPTETDILKDIPDFLV